jgi:phosphoglycerol transferase MdoB-like AlkP superfamily enzyme
MHISFRDAWPKIQQFSPWIFCQLYCTYIALNAGQPLVIIPFTVSTGMAFMLVYLAVLATKSRVVHATLGLVLTLPIIVQMQSLHLSGDLLSAMALSNADSAKVINFRLDQFAPFVALVILALLTLRFPAKHRSKLPAAFIVILVGVYIALAVQNFKENGLFNPFRLPGLSFVRTVADIEMDDKSYTMDPKDREELEGYFRKDITYKDHPAFAQLMATVPQNPNIIVLFVEGFSARLMSEYGGSRPDLLPNFDRFYRQSVVVKNYFNHTAATIRGLRGQLTSSYVAAPESGEDGLGWVDQSKLNGPSEQGTVLSVPQLLRNHGYQSAFMTPHPEAMNINTVIRHLGFDKMVTGTQVQSDMHLNSDEITDNNLYAHLPTVALGMKEPYFLGVYNFGTHLFHDSTDNKWHDGDSPVLNRFHNLDVQFGTFLDRFMSDEKFKNTILIVTADHAAFPAPEYLSVEKDATPNVFVDRVPMMMYWRGARHQVIDVAGRNSLGLAPTVMELAKIQKERNYFLGCSVFAPECKDVNYVTAIDEFSFFTKRNRVEFFRDIMGDQDYVRGKARLDRFLSYSNF